MWIQYNTIKGLACTFRASRYSARLSWALVLTWVSPSVQDKNLAVWVGRRVDYLATTFALPEHYRQYNCDSESEKNWAIGFAMFLVGELIPK